MLIVTGVLPWNVRAPSVGTTRKAAYKRIRVFPNIAGRSIIGMDSGEADVSKLSVVARH